MVLHAKEHHAQGFELPIRVLGVRDSFANHRLTTVETLKKSLWQGAWKLTEQDHKAFLLPASAPGFGAARFDRSRRSAGPRQTQDGMSPGLVRRGGAVDLPRECWCR